MNPKGRENSLRIAIPCNGNRIMPRFGLARDFFLVDIDIGSRFSNLRSCQWEPSIEPSVARWLRSLKMDGVVCDGIHPRFQTALRAEGLWVLWGTWGEIEDVLHRLVEGTLSAPPKENVVPPAPCCGRQKTRGCKKQTFLAPKKRGKNP
jgi:predicted Fe-Mo cluster-binding NifX family protein